MRRPAKISLALCLGGSSLFGSLLCGSSLMLACTCGPDGQGGTPVVREHAPPSTETPAGAHEGEAAPECADVAGGLAWNAAEPLVSRRPSSAMRAAEYGVRDHADAEMTVFHFGAGQGGSVDENVDRWVGQFVQPDGSASRDVAAIERTTVGSVPVTRVDVRGTFGGSGMGGGPPAADAPGRTGWRMLGAIAEGPGGMVFFKLTGPEDAIDEAEGAFGELVASIRPAD